jgi:RND family efflux transporter MFP subunit
VSGVIKALHCEANMQVKAGELCAKIDPRSYQIAVDQNKAELKAADARLEKDNADLAQAKAAFEHDEAQAKRRTHARKSLLSRKSFERVQTQTTRDAARVAELQTSLRTAETNLGDTDIVSPLDGTVVSRNVELGQTVAAASETRPLFVIAADLAIAHIGATISAKGSGEIKPGDKATFTVEAFPKRQFTGTVMQIRPSPQTDEHAATYDVVISAPNTDLLLKPGMAATIRIGIE